MMMAAKRMTRPEAGTPAVRMIVPGIETYCFDKTRAGERAFRARRERKDSGFSNEVTGDGKSIS